MAARNNFKELENEELKKYPHTPDEIEHNVKGSMRFVQFIGDIVELYLPKVFDLFISLAGGERAPEEVTEHSDADMGGAAPNGEQKPD